MFRLIWAASAHAHAILSYAPTNLLIAATRPRRGLGWGIPAMLLAVPYWFVASWCMTTIDSGGPGWLNLLVLLAIWNMLKLFVNGPITVLLLFYTWTRDVATRRRAHRVSQTERCDEVSRQRAGTTGSVFASSRSPSPRK